MFGVVPKPLWQRKTEVDADNRIPLDTNCLLIERLQPGHRSEYLLVDSGYGNYLSDKEREQLAAEGPVWPLEMALSRMGLERSQIRHVTFSHLHFDHAGGAVMQVGDGWSPTFPEAKHYIQTAEWTDAMDTSPELAGSYFRDHLRPLEPHTIFIEGSYELWPNLILERTEGHTSGHQLIRILNAEGRPALFTGDLFPTVAHLRPQWNMAYDQNQRVTRRKKVAILQEIQASSGWILFDHDPLLQGVRVREDARGGWETLETRPKATIASS